MAIDALAGLIFRLLGDLVLTTAGYCTAWALIPALTLGRVVVAPILKRHTAFQEGGRFARRADGKFALEAELAACFGILFWALVGAGAFIYSAVT